MKTIFKDILGTPESLLDGPNRAIYRQLSADFPDTAPLTDAFEVLGTHFMLTARSLEIMHNLDVKLVEPGYATTGKTRELGRDATKQI